MNTEIESWLDALEAGDVELDDVRDALAKLISQSPELAEAADSAVKSRFLAGRLDAPTNHALRRQLGGIGAASSDLTAPLPGTATSGESGDVTAPIAGAADVTAGFERPTDATAEYSPPADARPAADVTAHQTPAPQPPADATAAYAPPRTAEPPEDATAEYTPPSETEQATRIRPAPDAASASERTAPRAAPGGEQTTPTPPPDAAPEDDATRQRTRIAQRDPTVPLQPAAEATQPKPPAPDVPTPTLPIGQVPPPNPNATLPIDQVPPPAEGATLPIDRVPPPVADAQAATLAIADVPPPSRMTGSNWAHPEQWSDTGGPPGPGDTIGRFYIEAVLGQGGMGMVLKARDRMREEARDPNPYVAMKVLSEEFKSHPQSFIALAREWKKAAELSHENIITVYDFDRVGGTVFMTMELLDGEPLDAILKQHALKGLPPERARKIVLGCARALAFAHSRGIVHADFKPGNVFVLPNDEVKVLDFGIARAVPTALKPARDEQTVFDAADLGALTPAYASAEMLAGEAPTTADDVFALALTAYYVFTGRHPYDKLPADVARQRGARVAPLTVPLRRERRAIQKGIAFDAATRQEDAGVFLRQWEGSQLPRWVYAALSVSILAAAVFGWRSLQEPGPDRPFASLSADEQALFVDLVAQGNEALGAADNEGITAFYDDALELFSQAYAIHPRNPDAVSGLRGTADGWLRWLDKQPAELREARLRSGLRKYVCQDYLSTYRPVATACEATLGEGQCSIEGPVCTGGR